MNGRERGPQFCTGRTEPSGTREAARQRGGVREGATGGGGGIAGDGRHVWGVQQCCEEVSLRPQHLDDELI
jgi:hypothetical protein